ncbi:MAG: methionine synthase [Selenomonadaceae bacterium]|nr:methionine synthase [Selenomonadaceae bacterium]
MAIYNVQILKIDAAETRRYAGLKKAPTFDEKNILDACDEALFLLDVRGIYKIYDYDCEKHIVNSAPPFEILGNSIIKHLAGCEKVACIAVTVGENIEREVTKKFAAGNYVASVLLDAAATAAVEQAADELEKAIAREVAKESLKMRWRFSPGYGDWQLENQKNFFYVTGAPEIGMNLTESLMLVPRKSVTAIIGLEKIFSNNKNSKTKKSCANCDKKNCLARS